MGTAKHPHDSRRPESAAVKLGVEIFREEGNIEPLRSALSHRQRAFCEEYIVDFNGTAAVIRAGYAPDYADRQAHILKMNMGVSAYIDYLSTSKEAKIAAVTPDYVIQQITSVIHKQDVKDGDKLRALELLARHLGMFIERVESKTTIDIQEKQKIEEDASDFVNHLKSLQKKDDKKDITLVP